MSSLSSPSNFGVRQESLGHWNMALQAGFHMDCPHCTGRSRDRGWPSSVCNHQHPPVWLPTHLVSQERWTPHPGSWSLWAHLHLRGLSTCGVMPCPPRTTLNCLPILDKILFRLLRPPRTEHHCVGCHCPLESAWDNSDKPQGCPPCHLPAFARSPRALAPQTSGCQLLQRENLACFIGGSRSSLASCDGVGHQGKLSGVAARAITWARCGRCRSSGGSPSTSSRFLPTR